IFKIASESGIGAGTRRIEAVTSKHAYTFVMQKLSVLKQASELLKTNEEKVPERIESLYTEIKEAERENATLSSKLSNLQASSILDQVETIDGIPLLAVEVDGKDMNQLRGMVDELK